MRIGDFNRRATVQMQQAGVDEVGQPSTQWVDLATSLPCNVLVNSGRAQIAAGADVSRIQASIRIRWRTDITAGMRVVYVGMIFSIKAVLPDFAGRRYVDLVCEVAQ
ncbi:phage head closure protein [Paraburkholderia sp. LEh10]|uniref:phage head closure protein n=1 Tax=Paraburkholderia sp. LEh10 TaxID=2821353 RepID=UPI001AE2634E|nr:phage head closure protein [Paraburkholderia sp. LEh10]MBP0589282.1 phage head closure protein [Paraburkholderia sp. LEh10]